MREEYRQKTKMIELRFDWGSFTDVSFGAGRVHESAEKEGSDTCNHTSRRTGNEIRKVGVGSFKYVASNKERAADIKEGGKS